MVEASGNIGVVPDAQDLPQVARLSELAGALQALLARCPHRVNEKPGWLANYAWSEELVGWKPTPEEAAEAMAELNVIVTEAA